MEIEYKQLGERIKAQRLKIEVPQDKFAEIVELSTPHMSHIETGRTKVSLPTLVKIANALGVSLDDLVCDSLVKAKVIFQNEIATVTSDCTDEEIRIIADMTKALKQSLRNRVKS